MKPMGAVTGSVGSNLLSLSLILVVVIVIYLKVRHLTFKEFLGVVKGWFGGE